MAKKLLSLLLALTLCLSVLPMAVQAASKTGDSNGDGSVTVMDATLIQYYVAELISESEVDLTAADTDKDGAITVLDATRIQLVVAELEVFDDEETSIDVCLGSEPGTLDPAINSSVDGSSLLMHLFSGLAKWTVKDNGTFAIVPDAAEELPEGVQNKDGTVTYTYTLRDGLKWSDGQAVTAADYEFAWQRAASVALYADYGYMFEVVDGYDEVWATDLDGNPVDPDAKLNVTATDDKTLVVTLKSDVPYWNELLAFPTFFPVREDVVENESWAAEADTFVCNGLYTMDGWEHGSLITLQKNEDHPDADKVTMDTIRFHLSDDGEALQTNFTSGDWLFIDEVFADLDSVKENYPDAFHTAGQLGTYYLYWNVNQQLLPEGSGLTGAAAEKARAEIRQALSMLIDRNYIVDGITRGGQLPASSFVAMGMTDADGTEFCQNCGVSSDFDGYFDTSAKAYSTNVKKAVEVLGKYYDFDEKTKRFTNVPALTYVYNNNVGHQLIGEYIQDVFGSIGITVTLESQDWMTFLYSKNDGNFSFARGGWLADYNDPITFLDMWTSYSGNNDAHFGWNAHAGIAAYDLDLTPYGYDVKVENGTWEQTYDRLIAVIKSCKDKDTRYQLMHLAEDMLMSTGCVTPIYFYTDIYMLNPKVKGFFSNPLGMKFFMYTTVEE